MTHGLKKSFAIISHQTVQAALRNRQKNSSAILLLLLHQRTNTKMPEGLVDLQVRLRRLGNKALGLPEYTRVFSCIKPSRILARAEKHTTACSDDERTLTSSEVAGNQHHQIMKDSPRPPGQSLPSRPIPLPSSHIHRTRSELQLETDQSDAKLRESAMFNRLADGMAANRKGLDFIFINQQAPSTTKTQHMEAHQEKHGGLCNDEVEDLSRVLRRASKLCCMDTNGSKGESSEVEEGIFLIDDL